MLDILIKNGTIIDGLGVAPYQGDIAIKDGIITEAGGGLTYEAASIIDAAGRYVSPGFIDMHSHGDCTAFLYPALEGYLAQGITTIFTGHCGLSVSPVDKWWLPMLEEYRAACKITGETDEVIPGFTTLVKTSQIAEELEREYGVDVDWHTHEEYMRHLERAGIGANMMCLVGHAQLRHQIMGKDACRTATESEIERMCALLERELIEGAPGLSFGLDYSPGVFTDMRELVALAKTVAKRGGIVAAHTRAASPGYMGHNKGIKPIDGIRELLEIGLLSGAHVHISHMPYDKTMPGDDARRAAANETLALIDEYRARGVYVTWDALNVCGWFAWNELAEKLTPYIYEMGGKRGFREKLNDPAYRACLGDEIRAGCHRSRSPFARIDQLANPAWGDALKIVKCTDASRIGKTIGEIAREDGVDAVDALFDILLTDMDARAVSPAYTGVSCNKDAANAAFLERAECTIGFDGAGYDLSSVDAHYDMPAHFASSAVYSGMVTYLLLHGDEPIERSVERATGSAARALGLANRGVIAAGNAADIVIFDKNALDNNIGLADPRQAPKGIDTVIVNGGIAVENGALTGARNGKILRRM